MYTTANNAVLDGDENRLEQNTDAVFKFGTAGAQDHDDDDEQGNTTGFSTNNGSNNNGSAEGREIYVGVRLRPASELVHRPIITNALNNIIECPAAGAHSSETSNNAKRSFTFSYDTVFNHVAKQEDIMRTVGLRALDRVLKGYNGAVLCYGQSGSGKTHTMIGSGGGKAEQLDFEPLEQEGESGWDEGIGLLPRMLHTLFVDLETKHGPMPNGKESLDEAEQASEEPFWSVELSAVELYNEELRDLLVGVPPPSTTTAATTTTTTKPSRQSFRASAARGTNEPVSRTETTVYFQEDPDEPTPSKPSATKRDGRRGSGANISASNSRRQSFARRQSLTSAGGSVPPVPPTPPLRILQAAPSSESTGMSVYVEGLTRHKVLHFTDALALVRRALQERKMGETRLNTRSNRSHTIFFVYVHQREVAKVRSASPTAGSEELETGLVQVKRSVLTLVDLAGSERVSQTGAEGQQLVEAQRINLSLTLLGNVIRRLTARMVHSHAHIPYRDSKLTRLLQDCFGGNAVTYLLCTLSPEDSNRSESLSTLRFAQLAKKVKNKATMNTSISSGSVEEQLKQAFDYIAWLENQLKLMVSRAESSTASPPAAQEPFQHHQQEESLSSSAAAAAPSSNQNTAVPPSADIIFIRSLFPHRPGATATDDREASLTPPHPDSHGECERERQAASVASSASRPSHGSAESPADEPQQEEEEKEEGEEGTPVAEGEESDGALPVTDGDLPEPAEEDSEGLRELVLNGDGEVCDEAEPENEGEKGHLPPLDVEASSSPPSPPVEEKAAEATSVGECENSSPSQPREEEEENPSQAPEGEEEEEKEKEEQAHEGEAVERRSDEEEDAAAAVATPADTPHDEDEEREGDTGNPPAAQTEVVSEPAAPVPASTSAPASATSTVSEPAGEESPIIRISGTNPTHAASAPAESPLADTSVVVERLPHVPPFDLDEEEEITPRHFLQSYGHCTPIGAAAEAYRFHPLSTPSLITAPLHPVTHSAGASVAEDWDEPDMDEFSTKKYSVGSMALPPVQQKVKKGALQRMMDAMRLAAAIATTADQANY